MPHWHSERFDELIDSAESVRDHNWRMTLYREADRILVAEETAVLPLSYGQGRILVKPWVKLPVSPIIAMPLNMVIVAR